MVLNPSSQVSWTIRIPSSNSLLQVFKATAMQKKIILEFHPKFLSKYHRTSIRTIYNHHANNCSKHHPKLIEPPWNSLPPGTSGWMDTTPAKELLAILTNAGLVSGDLFFVFTISISELHLYHCKYLISKSKKHHMWIYICTYTYVQNDIQIFIFTYIHTHAHMWLFIYI